MTVVTIFDQEKNSVGELTLPAGLFEVEVRPELLNLVVKAHNAAQRTGTVGVKTRSNIRGGGKKPWRQKGTGRARAGSVRSPLWTGGAVTHGPQSRSYDLKVNKKVRKLAMKMALSSKLATQSLVVVDKVELAEPKTKRFVQVQNSLELKKALIVVPKRDMTLELASRNVPGMKVVTQSDLNVVDILKSDVLVVTPEVVENLQERLQ
jgi:large subunit ribosomal protein L4